MLLCRRCVCCCCCVVKSPGTATYETNPKNGCSNLYWDPWTVAAVRAVVVAALSMMNQNGSCHCWSVGATGKQPFSILATHDSGGWF